MGRIVVSEFVSLDGVTQDPGGGEGYEHGGWAFRFERGADGDRYKLDELMEAEAMLLGRVTYEGFATAWPSVTDDTGFAAKMNGMPKYVVTNTLERAAWEGTTILRGDPVEAAAKLRDALGGSILVAGSMTLVQALQDADLVDEYRLMVYPTVLGSGKRLFRDGARTSAMELVEARRAGATAILTLRPLRAEEAAPAA